MTINMEEDVMEKRFGDKLEQLESGFTPSVLAKVISAFTGKKVQTIKKGSGFNAAGDDKSKSIRCSMKANDGFLFPLEKAFFFISTKPAMVEYDRVASVEFNRVEQSGTANASRSFDLTCALKDGGATQFVNLARSEYKKLYDYLVTRKVSAISAQFCAILAQFCAIILTPASLLAQIRIKNIAQAGSSSYAEDGGDDDDDPYMNQIKHQRAQEDAAMDDDDDDDDEDEDEDFAPGAESDVDEEYDEGDEADEDKMGGKKGKGGGSDDDSDDSDAPAAGGGGGSDDSDDEESKPLAKKPKVASGKAPAKPKPPPKEPKGKKGKKKDPNAPKRGLSAFMFFSNAMRETIKAENPEASFGELGKIAGQKWKEMDDASKEPYLTKASEDKARYEREKAEHKAATGASAADDDDSDSD